MSSTLRGQVVRGVGWSAADQILQQVLGLISLFVLARLLTPSDYGTVGMVTVFTGFVGIFAEMGLGRALVHKQDLTPAHLSTVFWTNVLLGMAVFLVLFWMAGLVAWFYDSPDLKSVTRVIAANFLITPLAAVPRAMILKRMAFKSIAIRNVVALAAGTTVAVVMAWHGYGYWSLVASILVNQVAGVILFWAAEPWRPKLIFRPRVMKDIIRYGLYLSGSNMVGYWSRQTDRLLIGAMAGGEALGLYTRAYMLMLLPVQQVAGRVDAVLFPAFASIQHDTSRIASIYLKMTRLVALLTFPMMFGLWVVADDFVRIALGPNWLDTVPLVRILCPLGAVQSILTMNGSLYLSLGRTDLAFRVTLGFTIACAATFCIGLWLNGVTGLAVAYTIFSLATAPWIYLIAARLVNLTLMDMVRNLAKIFLCAMLMSVTVYLAKLVIPFDSSEIRLATSVSLGVFVYWVALHMLRVSAYREAVDLVRERLAIRKASRQPIIPEKANPVEL